MMVARSIPQQFTQKKSIDEQQQEEKLHQNPTTPLHRNHTQQRSLSPTRRSNNTARDQQEQQKHDHCPTTEDDSLCPSTGNNLPPLWTEGFAEGVTNSVKRRVDGLISRGSLLRAPKRKFWSSLTPADIIRSSSQSEDGDDDHDDDDVLGSGSFSKVTKVQIKGKEDNNSSSCFALKRLKGDLLPSKLTEHSCKNGSVIAFTKAATELAREAFLLSRLDHPNIINIMGWTDGGVTSYSEYRRHDAYFLVLELLQEETLEDRIDGWNQDDAYLETTSWTQDKRKQHFHRRKIEQLSICKQVASALAYIHSKNVVYRDLKPQNIGFTRGIENNGVDSEDNVVVKLMDFGLARELPSRGILQDQRRQFQSYTTQANSSSLFDMTGTVGTIRYMAPEVCLNRPYGLECDIYSWSIVAHEILSQTKPYDDMTPDMYQSLVCQQGVRPHTQNMPSEHIVLLTQAWRTDPAKRLPFNRILRQLDLFLQQEKLIWEAQELLSGMPEKTESPIFLSQSYSYENNGNKNCSRQGVKGRAIKRSWYRANNDDDIPSRTPRKNPIFPNASMDSHGENTAMSGYTRNPSYNYDYNHTVTERATSMYEQPQSYFETTNLYPPNRLPKPVTPDRHYTRHDQKQPSHEMPVRNYHNSGYNGYSHHNYHHYNGHNGAGTRSGHLSPSNDHGHWSGDYY